MASSQGELRLESKYPAPKGMAYRKYQIEGIEYALERRNTIIGDEMGLGKTPTAIGVANAIGAKSILVICPASLRLMWRNEFEIWGNGHRDIHVIESGKGHIQWTSSVNIVNYDLVLKSSLREEIMETHFDLMILDEAHYLKNPKAKRTSIVLGGRGSAGLISRADRVVALTGTPLTNRPLDLWPLLHSLDPEKWQGFMDFVKRYCAAQQRQVPARGGKKLVWDFTGASHLAELNLRLRDSVMIRRLKADVLQELPPKIRRIITIAPTPGIARLVKQEAGMYANLEASFSQSEMEIPWSPRTDTEMLYKADVARLRYIQRVAFGAMASVRHQIALKKLVPGVEYILGALDTSRKVIVFAHHKQLINQLIVAMDRHDISSVCITGDTPLHARQAAVDAFQQDPDIRVLVGNIQAAGVGLTLTAASHVIFLEQSWVPSDMDQAADRAHRIGQRDSVLIDYLVFDGSLDARIMQAVTAKQSVIDEALSNG